MVGEGSRPPVAINDRAVSGQHLERVGDREDRAKAAEGHCGFCRKRGVVLSRCTYCRGLFCDDHLSPAYHDCPTFGRRAIPPYVKYAVIASAIIIFCAGAWLLVQLSGSNVYTAPQPAPTARVVGYNYENFNAIKELIVGTWANSASADVITFKDDRTFSRRITGPGNRSHYTGEWSIESSPLYTCRLKYDGVAYEEGLRVILRDDGSAHGWLVPLCSSADPPPPAELGYEKTR